MPGQGLSYDQQTDALRVFEASDLWAGCQSDDAQIARDLIETTWQTLGDAVRRSVDPGMGLAIMVSGGWDSRTLLAAAVKKLGASRVVGYSHGDVQSRELQIARGLATRMGVGLRAEPIDGGIYSFELLEQAFAREENLVFPHWHRAGRVLRADGVNCVTAGVYGEVLGGHYGRGMLLGEFGRMIEVGRWLLGRKERSRPLTQVEFDSLYDFLRLKGYERPPFIHPDFWAAIDAPRESINADIRADLERLRQRGIDTAERMVEAYVTEHRGSQYIGAQLRSCRSYVDVAMPFADREVLRLASCIRISEKIHNGVNRRMLARFCPVALTFPLAATLVAAQMPILFQEASRLLRKGREAGHWALHFRYPGKFGPPRLAWVNFEFLRRGTELMTVVEDLRCGFWDTAHLRRRIEAIRRGQWKQPLHPTSDLLLRIYTVDRMLRPTS
jgi:hypothetical protein